MEHRYFVTCGQFLVGTIASHVLTPRIPPVFGTTSVTRELHIVGNLLALGFWLHTLGELDWDFVIPADLLAVLVVLIGRKRRVTVRVTKLLPNVFSLVSFTHAYSGCFFISTVHFTT